MRIVLFGATGRTGTAVLQEATRRGHDVIAVVRDPQKLPAHHGAHVVQGDVREPDQWAHALEGADAVISTIGIGNQQEPTTVYSDGIAQILDAMHEAHVARILVVSAMPAADREQWRLYGWFAGRVLFPILYRALRATYDDMRRIEQRLRASDVIWSSYRVPQLTDRPATGTYRASVSQPLRPAVRLTRADLAAALLDGITAPQQLNQHVDIAN